MKLQTTKIYKYVDNAHKQGYRLISLQGGARSSKTYSVTIWLIMYALLNPGKRISVVRKTLPALKGSVLVDFKEIMQKMQLYQDTQFNKSNLIYTFSNGSVFEFFSTDNEQKLRGRKRHILFGNEATEFSPIEYQQLDMRTIELTILDYNPSYTDEHFLKQLNGKKTTKHVITTYKDNPFLEQTIIDKLEEFKHTNKSLWQIYGLGQQSMIEGLIFTNVTIVDIIPDYCKRKWIGIDFGYSNDPTAIVEVYEHNNDLYIDEIAYNTKMLTADIVESLKNNCKGIKVISESADPRLIDEIHRAKINIHPVKKYQGSVLAGIQRMQGFNNIYITKRSINAIKEFNNYTYKQDKNAKFLNEPIDMFNHIIDAVRYVVLSEIMKKKSTGQNVHSLKLN